MIPVGSYPVFYLGHVLICLCLHVSMGLGLQLGICCARWSLAQHVPLTKPCPANDVTCVDLLMMWIMMVGSISPPLTLADLPGCDEKLTLTLTLTLTHLLSIEQASQHSTLLQQKGHL